MLVHNKDDSCSYVGDREKLVSFTNLNKCNLIFFIILVIDQMLSPLQITINLMLIVFLKVDQTLIILDVRSYLYDHQHLNGK
jgi:hypothetical protein